MKQPIRLGVVCLARKTFDYQAAKEIYNSFQQKLKEIEAVNWEFIPKLVIEIQDAQEAAHSLATREIDGLVCISGTFALGHLVLELNKITRRPILLWGLNELPYDGGKIRLNSVCGINLNASNLYKAGVKNYHVIIGDDIDEDWVDAIRVIKAFSTAHIGILGYRARGFFNLDVDELDLYNQIGLLIDHYELQGVFEQAITTEKVNERKKQIQVLFDVSALDEGQLERVAQLVVKLDTFMEENRLTALAVRCWPEFAANYGVAPCAAMSILQAEGKILTCEGGCIRKFIHVGTSSCWGGDSLSRRLFTGEF